MIQARKLAILLCGAALCGGCAPAVKPQSASPPPAAQEAIPVPGTVEPLQTPARTTSAMIDSMPSADAERVLATIPEPLAPSQIVPPPVVTRRAPTTASDTLRAGGMVSLRAPAAAFDSLRVDIHRSARAPASSFDTLRAEAPQAAADTANVPVPAPTEPLGDRSGSLTMPDSLTLAAAETTATTRPVSAPVASTAPVASIAPLTNAATGTRDISAKPMPDGACWRVQIAAPAREAEADSRQDAARSLLVAPMVIEPENGLYKVRTQGCLTREAADALRKRAVDSGFEGAFVVNTGVALPAKPAPKPAAKKSPIHRSSAKKPTRR